LPLIVRIFIGIWRPYKELLEIVERAVYQKRPEYQHDLELALKKFKPDFMTLLKNPVSTIFVE
jgi:nuclear pore complex protein Nup205